ncbi:hypothetical protein [Herbiconiux sp.]|uniref:hypothetical protein n=1 Tax=Herbiconiux sp. TaxID=1871186 RepID=UPI0025C68F22|nr:hypothetical protein [Herbiconiux sp.]
MSTMTVVKNGRLNPDVRLWTGIAAIAVGTLTLAEFVLQLVLFVPAPSLDDADALVRYASATADLTLVNVLFDTFLLAAIVVFVSGFRQLITQARPDLQWVTGILFGSGLLLVLCTLVGDALQGATALDTMDLRPDPSSLRTLVEGHTLLFGSVGCTLTALVAASAAYVIIASAALPAWTGYLAYAVAGLNLLAVPTMFGGTNPDAFFAAAGGATVLLATFPWLIWVFCVGIVAIRDRRRIEHLPAAVREAVGR